jgi:hypothetical protein
MRNSNKTIVLFVVLICILPNLVSAEQANPSDILSTLDKNHPRLMLKDKDIANLKQQYAADKVLQKCLKESLEQADGYLDKPMLKYEKIGPRLLHVSRECMHRIYALGLAWRWTGEEKYAKKAVENLLTVCAFNDWNPSHFLDTAEMSHAVGVGYDWLYSYLDAPTREKIKAGLIKNGLEPGLVAYEKQGWSKSEHNWNQVCNGGLVAGALAIAESDPQYAEKIVAAAIESLPRALNSYNPDGAWGEGPGYWSYATHYTAYGLTALQTALGKDFGLSKTDGLAEAGNFVIYTTGPTGLFLNFADSGEKNTRRPMPCIFWLARTFNNPLYAEDERSLIAGYTASPQHIIWYVPAPQKKPPAKKLDCYFHGSVEVAVFRSSWDDPDALFVGVKAGYNQVNHGHLDLGNFELDAMGVRWACDLGSDNYNMPGYWDKKTGGQRWSYYRLNSASHNVPLLNGRNQDPQAASRFVKVQTETSQPFAIVDLTDAYKESAKKVTRGVAMVQNRRAVLVQDEFRIETPCELTWGMTTDAKISIREKGVAVLAIKDKELIAKVLSPSGAEFAVESAEQKPPEKANEGVSRLVLRLPDSKGSIQVSILLSPAWKDGNITKTVELKPLEKW